MALGFTYSSGGGDFIAIMKYDARAGRIFREDREQDASGSWVKDSVDLTSNFTAVFDCENIEIGWINFPLGAAPDFVMVAAGQPMPNRPSANHSQGVRFMMKLSKAVAADAASIREISGTSQAFKRGIEDLHNDYEAQKAANPGKLPIVTLKSTTPVTSGQGTKKSTNYQPVFEIVGWAPRPDDLVFVPKSGAVQPVTAPVAHAAPPSTGSTVVTPPAAKAAPALATADFG
jgi:hypothetical protein